MVNARTCSTARSDLGVTLVDREHSHDTNGFGWRDRKGLPRWPEAWRPIGAAHVCACRDRVASGDFGGRQTLVVVRAPQPFAEALSKLPDYDRKRIAEAALSKRAYEGQAPSVAR